VVKMKVVLPELYPLSNPLITFEKVKGLSDAELEELKCLVQTKIDKELSGQNREMIFDLTQLVEEFLQRHNLPPQSLHDQMVARQKAMEQDARERMLMKQRQEQEEADSFQSNYEQRRRRTLLGESDEQQTDDVFSAMGREVSKVMSYKRPSNRKKSSSSSSSTKPPSNSKGNKATANTSKMPTSMMHTQTRNSPDTCNHLLDGAGSGDEMNAHSGTDDTFDHGYSTDTSSSSSKDEITTRKPERGETDEEDYIAAVTPATATATNTGPSSVTAGRRGDHSQFDIRKTMRGVPSTTATVSTSALPSAVGRDTPSITGRASQKKGAEDESSKARRGTSTTTDVPTKAAGSSAAASKPERSFRENTFFASPVGLDWDHHEDADSDEYEDADKTRGAKAPSSSLRRASGEGDTTLIVRPIARVQKSLIKWIHPRELSPSTTCKLYKAIDASNEKSIVVKEYQLPVILDLPKTELLEGLCEMISRASRSLSHTHLSRYLGADYRPQTNQLYILRDFLPGEVSTVLKARPLDESKVRNYITQIVSSVAYLHGIGIFGLNIKANNMLLDNQGTLKLADYLGASQIAALLNPNWKASGETNWWAPEVKQQRITEREQDLVDIGLTMIELSTGSRSRPALPSNFTAHAQNFCNICLSGKGQTINDLKVHPYIAFDSEEFTQGEFVPLSPASSAPGFHMFMRPGERSEAGFTGFGDTTTWGTSSNHTNNSPSSMANTNNTSSTTSGTNSNPQQQPLKSSVTSTGPADKAPSRYRIDFEEIEVLGKGGFGQVVKARNRLDDNLYAIKKIRFGRTDAGFVEKLKREVMTLSRLNHPHVVRYFNAWIGDADEEESFVGDDDDRDEDDEGEDGSEEEEDMDESEEESEYESEDYGFQSVSESDDNSDGDDVNGGVMRNRFNKRVGKRDYGEVTSSEEDIDDDDEDAPSLVLEEEQDLFDQSLTGRTFDETMSFNDEDEARLRGMGGMLSSSRAGRRHKTIADRRREQEETEASGRKGKKERKYNNRQQQPQQQQQKRKKRAFKDEKNNTHNAVKPPSKILYIQMEYCTEKTLKNMIDEHSLSDEMKWKLFRQIVEGLHHIHSQGIIHRDLKPTNVFIDSLGDTKIGDFGLAVTSGTGAGGAGNASGSGSADGKNNSGHVVLANSRQASSRPPRDGLTTGVGTPLYLAPEQDRPGAYYNQKVDVYSLGIIFFELFNSFSTAMERYTVVMGLRTKEIKVPPAWEKDPIKCKLVRWMLSHDPEDRPSTLTLLQSELLPVKLEDETLMKAMRSITSPNTTMHSLLLKRLFGVPSDPTTDVSYDLETPLRIPYEAVIRQNASRRLVKIFQTHAASYVEPACFFPRPSLYLNPHAVQFLSPTGTVVSVPFDLTMPFARFIAQKNIRFMRRYVFGKVYRATSGQPREMRECDFDLVGATSNRLAMTAEAMQVLVEILHEFRDELGRSVVRFNNFKVLDAILFKISESMDVQRKIRSVLAQFWRKHSPRETEKLLLSLEGVTAKALDAVKMEQLLHISKDLTCPAMDTLSKIEALYPRDKVILEMIRETKQFVSFAELYRIVTNLRFDITLIYNYEYYYDIMFQGFLLSGDVIAAGGCYDTVVDYFAMLSEPGVVWGAGSSSASAPFGKTKKNKTNTNRSAVGINIALDNLVNRIFEHQRKQEEQALDWVGSAQIVVFSHLRHPIAVGAHIQALEDRIQVVQSLWKHKLPAEYQYDENHTLDSLTRECEAKGTQWLVILKDIKTGASGGTVSTVSGSYSEKKTIVRVKDVRGHTETTMTLGDLPHYFIHRINPYILGDTGESFSSMHHHLHHHATGSGSFGAVGSSAVSGSSGSGGGGGGGGGGGDLSGMGGVSVSAVSGASGKSATRSSIDFHHGGVSGISGSGTSGGSGSVSQDSNLFRTAESDCLDVEIIGPLRQEKGAKGKRDIVRAASEKIAPILKNFAPKAAIKVAAVDIPLPQIREVLFVLEAGGDIGLLERKLVKVKDRIPYIKEYWVKVRRDKHPYAFFYSIIDEDYQLSFLKR